MSFRRQSGGETGAAETAGLKLRREPRQREARTTGSPWRRWHQGRAGDGAVVGRANTELPGSQSGTPPKEVEVT